MALIQCPECGKSVSSTCPTCPHCGFAFPKSSESSPIKHEEEVVVLKRTKASKSRFWVMALLITLVFAIGLVLWIVGVSNNSIPALIFGIVLVVVSVVELPIFIVSWIKGNHRIGVNNANTCPILVYDPNKKTFVATSLGKSDLVLTVSQVKSLKIVKVWAWGKDVSAVWFGDKQLLGACGPSGIKQFNDFVKSLEKETKGIDAK